MFNKERGIRILIMNNDICDSMLIDVYEFEEYGFGNMIDPKYRSTDCNDLSDFLIATKKLLNEIDNGMDVADNSDVVDDIVNGSVAKSASDCKFLHMERVGEVWTIIQDRPTVKEAHESQVTEDGFIFNDERCDIVINLQDGQIYTSLFNRVCLSHFKNNLGIKKGRDARVDCTHVEFRLFDIEDIIQLISITYG